MSLGKFYNALFHANFYFFFINSVAQTLFPSKGPNSIWVYKLKEEKEKIPDLDGLYPGRLHLDKHIQLVIIFVQYTKKCINAIRKWFPPLTTH